MGALVFWGRGLLIGGLAGAALSAAPALILSQLPAEQSDGFYGALAGLLSLTVTPLSLLIAGAGAILWLVAYLRRYR
jgi:hypothetical protein